MERKSKRFFRSLLEVFFVIAALTSQQIFMSCAFFADGEKDNSSEDAISAIRLTNSTISTSVGGVSYIGFSTTPSKSITPEWSYDSSIIQIERQANGAVITGLAEGQSSLTVTYQKKSATAIVTVSGYSDTYVDTTEPYIYSSTSVMQMQPNDAETIHVSLYNGTAADIDGYTWTIENPAVASISPTGQYCTIKSLSQGYSRIKVTHSRAAYPYYVGVYVLDDISKVTFITTKDNMVKLSTTDGEKSVSVSLTNPKSENYSKDFSWKITEGSEFLSITSNAADCVFAPIKAGQATVRVTHSDADYPLDITVRVVEIIENVYVEPSTTVLTLNGLETNTDSVTAKLIGISEGKDYSNDEFYFEVEQETDSFGNGRIVDFYSFANNITFTGKHNGSAVLYIGHPKSAKKRQVLVIAENQTADAVDASCMITTTQNYIKTKVGADETRLTVALKGGSDEDNLNFRWSVNQQPKDGSSDVIELVTTDGTVTNSRAAAQTYTYGTAYIKPLAVGSATITVTNTKSYYPLEILVNVLDASAVLEEQYYFTGEGIVKFLNGETYDYTATLRSAPESVKGKITWESDSPNLIINASGETAQFSSTATGNAISHITVNHPSAQAPKEVLVLNADTLEELNSMKAFYSNKTYYSVNVESEVSIYASQVGFTDADGEELDFSSVASQVVWTSSDPTIASVERSGDYPLTGIVTGNKSGTAKITVKYGEVSATFTVTVYPKDVIIGEVEKSIYLTTTQNVIVLGSEGEMKTATVTAVGLESSKYSGITWSVQNEDVAKVAANGTSATITAAGEGETEIHISHPDSENTLKMYVRVGSEYVVAPNTVTYISASTDVIAVLKDTANYTLSAVLVNPENENDGLTGFSFSVDDTSIASIIAQYPTGSCYIKPESAGQTEITITHPKAAYPKKVLVVVGNTLEELSEFKYLTTSMNVVNIGEGATKSVTVTLENATETVIGGYTWKSADSSIASIAQTTSGTALISGNKIGTTKITVTHEQSKYSLEIIIQVIDPIAAAASPFIQVPNPILTLVESTSWSTLTAELVGGTDSDAANFIWNIYDGADVVDLYYQNGVAKIRAKKAGTAIVRVTHPKAVYPQDITLICDAASSTEYSISVSSGNIMSIRPDAGDQTITATLVNGSTTDKYNFHWSLDVYDIIDMTYSANTAIITPLKEGTATITVTHPKSAYDQQIVVKVQQYNSFGFSSVSKSVTAGQSTFITMEVPASSVATTVSYYSEDDSVARISGTKAVCQITGVEAGTVTVHAQLVAEKTGIVQSEADMLVIVTPAAESLIYITGTAGLASTFSMTQGTSKVMTAEIVGDGITISDQPNLVWSVPTDQNVITLASADSAGKVAGTSAYITAANHGETTLTITHSKTTYSLVYHIIVPGAEATEVTLDKHYVSIEKGKTTTVKATLSSGKATDYKALEWSISRLDGDEIATVNGNGQTVTIYGLKAGTVWLKCMFPESGSYDECQITINDAKTLELDRKVIRVMPGEKNARSFSYRVTPTDAAINWVYSSAIDGSTIFTFTDSGNVNGEGYVTVTGIKEGTSQLSGVSSYGQKVSIQVQVGWDYEFFVTEGETTFKCTPAETKEIKYKVLPSYADIKVSSTQSSLFDYDLKSYGVVDDYGVGSIVIKPKTESSKDVNITLTATNPDNGDEVVGSIDIKAAFQYETLTPKVSFVSSDGNFSRFENDTLVIGDGEMVAMKFDVLEEKANGQVKSVVFSKSADSVSVSSNLGSASGTYQIYNIGDTADDVTDYQYRIIEASVPYYAGKKIPNWEKVLFWHYEPDKVSNGTDDYFGLCYSGVSNTYIDFTGKGRKDITSYKWLLYWDDNGASNVFNTTWYSREIDASLSGKIYLEKEFRNIPWFYCPGFSGGAGDDGISVREHVITENVNAVYETSTDNTVSTYEQVGTLFITFSHLGKDEPSSMQIPVYYEVRKCAKNYSGN